MFSSYLNVFSLFKSESAVYIKKASLEISTKGKMTTLKPITYKADQTNGTLEHYPASPFL
jgi:hypothetical protein